MAAPTGGGIRFGNYVLLRRIARGGMAEVFLAQQRGLEGFDRRVAVKRILPHLADAPDFVKMFLGEARLAAQLSHPNVVHIYDFGKHDGDYFLAMEYIEGVHCGQLYKYGVEKERLPPVLVARLGADAANALHHAHELRGHDGKPLGIVHRDVSPANLMVSFDGVVKLCDFGIAKAALLGDQLTNPGQVKGKYAYMSPEQTTAGPLDGRSDVFSLAIVMWELLAGRTIVGRGDAVEAMRAIRDGKLPPITTFAPKTPPALVKALTWALQTRRETRATAMDFAQALEAFIKSSPELATPMQLASWIRARFPRDAATGQHPALPGVSVGTRASPGTQRASPPTNDDDDGPGTAVSDGTAAAVDTPPPQNALDTVDDEAFEGAETVSLDGEAAKAFVRGRAAQTTAKPFAVPRPSTSPSDKATVLAHIDQRIIDTAERAERKQALDTTQERNSDSMIMDGGATHADNEHAETVMRSGAYRQQISAGPSVVPTILNQPRLSSNSSHRMPAALTEVSPRLSARVPSRVLAIGGLVVLAMLSFVIALAAKSCGGARAVAPRDAVPDAVVVADAAIDVPVDVAIDAPVDAPVPTIAIDAAMTTSPDKTSVLEIRTRPAGGTVRISSLSESRIDPARFAVPPGTYQITADLDGYVTEKREVVMAYGIDVVQEIVFTRKRSATTKSAPATGKLTARTIPYSVVYNGTKKLGETPFADLELPVGDYTLTFRHPTRGAVTKQVTINAGKTTKVSFAIPN